MDTVLIVGLGNPGSQYSCTRHNVGFMTVDAIACDYDFPDFSRKGHALISSKRVNGNNIIILKPQTFMNLSGNGIAPVVSFLKVRKDNIIVFHDDMDVKLGSLKVKFAGGSGGHNGLKSIDSLISNNYWRVRIGIGRPTGDVVSYVLDKFIENECDVLDNVIRRISSNFDKLISDKNVFVQCVCNPQYRGE